MSDKEKDKKHEAETPVVTAPGATGFGGTAGFTGIPRAPDRDMTARLAAQDAQLAAMAKLIEEMKAKLPVPVGPVIPRPVRHQREEDARFLASLRRLEANGDIPPGFCRPATEGK